MANTTISVSASLDVIDRYRELVEASLDGDSIYIRAKETVERLYENSEMSGAKKAEIVASTVTSMAASISANCMQLALQWESQESELGLKKEELEYKIDLMKLEADKAKQDVAASEANKHLLQAKLHCSSCFLPSFSSSVSSTNLYSVAIILLFFINYKFDAINL